MSNNHKVLLTVIFVLSILAAYQLGRWQQLIVNGVVFSRDIIKINNDWLNYHRKQMIEKYNQGYRAGRLSTAAELIECHDLKENSVVDIYTNMSQIMTQLNEFDNSSYPCGE